MCDTPQKGEWLIRGNITTGSLAHRCDLQKWHSTNEIIWGTGFDVRRQLVLA